MIIAPISALTYPIAIVLPRKNEEALSIVKISIKVSVFFSLIVLLILLGFKDNIVKLFNIYEIENYLYLLPLVIILSAFAQVFEQWLIRTNQFSVNAKVTALESLSYNLSKIFFGLYSPIATFLILIQTGSIALKVYLYNLFSKNDLMKKIKNIKPNLIYSDKNIAKKYYDFPLYRSPQVMLNGISMSMPVLMLTTFFGASAAGFYTLCRTALSMPTQLIGKSISDVFYPRISQGAQRGENITKLLIKATLLLFTIGIIPFGSIVVFGPVLFEFIFGSDWITAGEYGRWVAIWVFFSFINRPSVMTLPVLSAQVYHLIYTVIMLISNLTMLFIGHYYFSSDIIALILVGVSGGVFSLLLIIMTIYLSGKRDKNLAK